MDEETIAFIKARRNQIEALLDPAVTNEYKRQEAGKIAARIARLESGEETLEPDLPIKKKRKATRRRGNPDKVDAGKAQEALHQAGGDQRLGWSKYVILKSLLPGCDAKDFYAWCDE